MENDKSMIYITAIVAVVAVVALVMMVMNKPTASVATFASPTVSSGTGTTPSADYIAKAYEPAVAASTTATDAAGGAYRTMYSCLESIHWNCYDMCGAITENAINNRCYNNCWNWDYAYSYCQRAGAR
jgi:hypothetical protein